MKAYEYLRKLLGEKHEDCYVCALMHAVKELRAVREEVCGECNKLSTKTCFQALQKVAYINRLLPKICDTRKKENHSWKGISHIIPFNKVQCVKFDVKCAIYFCNL